MAPNISVLLRVTGAALDLPAIQQALGADATSTWRKGETLRNTGMQRKSDGWEPRLPFRSEYKLESALVELRAAIAGREAELRRLCSARGYEITVTCVVEAHDETAGLVLEPELLSWLVDLGASFAVDTYPVAPS